MEPETPRDLLAPHETSPTPIEIPQKVAVVFEELKKILSSLPDTEFYFTMSPDYRAKVKIGTEFRVFAR